MNETRFLLWLTRLVSNAKPSHAITSVLSHVHQNFIIIIVPVFFNGYKEREDRAVSSLIYQFFEWLILKKINYIKNDCISWIAFG